MIDKSLLENGIAELGLAISGAQIDAFDKFAELLVETSKVINLTSILEPERIVTEHFLDSISCLSALTPPDNGMILDVGTGAGFPGLPIAIMCPDLECVLMDSTKKKLGFIDNICEELEISNVVTVYSRAEDAGNNKKYREAFDVVYGRAVSEMKVLSELCIPFVNINGFFIAQKSIDYEDELDKGRAIIGQLGGKISKIDIKDIPFTSIERALIVIEKIKKTPADFPRPYSKIKNKK